MKKTGRKRKGVDEMNIFYYVGISIMLLGIGLMAYGIWTYDILNSKFMRYLVTGWFVSFFGITLKMYLGD
jgi:uncharacterized membrane protein YiaA